MARPTRAWINYTNARKADLERAKALENMAAPVDFSAVSRSPEVRLPPVKAQPRERTANINYAVPLRRLRGLAKALGDINMTYRDVGINSFEYTYRAEVDEDVE